MATGICSHTNSTSAPTNTDLDAMYTGSKKIITDTLPEPSANGIYTDSVINAKISALETSGVIPTSPKIEDLQSAPFKSPNSNTPLSTYIEALNTFDTSLNDEYCFYEARYLSALNSFLNSLANAGTLDATNATTQAIQQKLNQTKNLNKKLIYLTQVANALEAKRYSTATTLQNGNTTINTTLATQQQKLLEQRQILTKETASADLYKRMVEYTTEKNRANQNLLVIYGVLNVTAIAMIFYVARS
jgi:hypothetical protein